MADSHGAHGETLDPNKAPLHQDIVENFAGIHVAIATVLGLAAAVAGIICGILIIND